MKTRSITVISSIVILGACSGTGMNGSDGTKAGFIKDLPEAVVGMAAPYQNLAAVRLLPDDGCFWYQHAGPVETTLLPLRTVKGNKICAKPQSEPATSG